MHVLRTKSLLVYLADLTHVGNGIATEAFPLNIGLIKSAAIKRFGTAVDIRLFKYPDKLMDAINARAPDVLGCSNYTWNFNLSCYFCRFVKSVSPSTLTVFGGTNYPFTMQQQEDFLRKVPALDLHVFYEGETSFGNILERILGGGISGLDTCIPGVQHLHPKTGLFLSGEKILRIKSLDDIPSPYSSGLLDEFFDSKLTPLVETARGCPFKCNFCNAGNSYFTNVNLFSDEYVKDELTYIARMASKSGSFHVTFADNNFGMIPRDSKTAELLYSLSTTHKWPQSVTVWTGKNSKERVIDVTKILGDRLSISMSVQSMDPQVLKNIQRDNIKLDHYKQISDSLRAQGRPQHAEVIMPLPGETLESHLRGLCELLDTGVSNVQSHTLQMLYGTPYKDDPNYRKQHGYQTRYRIVPLDFSRMSGEAIFDIEEVAIASRSMTFESYVEARVFLLVIDLCYNSGVFYPIQKYLGTQGILISTWIKALYKSRASFGVGPDAVFNSFRNETRSELWENEAELIAFYSIPANYQRLIDYELGGNVLFKHRVWMLSKFAKEWVETVGEITSALLYEEGLYKAEWQHELKALLKFLELSATECFTPGSLDTILTGNFTYDLLRWFQSEPNSQLTDFCLDQQVEYHFLFSPAKVGVLQDAFKRYGTDLAGLVKLVQRTSGIGYVRDANAIIATGVKACGEQTNSAAYGPGYSSM